MPRTPSTPNDETFTFRLDASLKADLARTAKDERLQPGELLRRLLRDHLAQKAQRAFEAEARRQSLAIAERARQTDSDEAQVMRELEANLDEGASAEWKA